MVDTALSSLGKSSFLLIVILKILVNIKSATQPLVYGLSAQFQDYPLSISLLSTVLTCMCTSTTPQEFIWISPQDHLQNQQLFLFLY